jgi:hypothetical protein
MRKSQRLSRQLFNRPNPRRDRELCFSRTLVRVYLIKSPFFFLSNCYYFQRNWLFLGVLLGTYLKICCTEIYHFQYQSWNNSIFCKLSLVLNSCIFFFNYCLRQSVGNNNICFRTIYLMQKFKEQSINWSDSIYAYSNSESENYVSCLLSFV